jgi:hypothetical protein
VDDERIKALADTLPSAGTLKDLLRILQALGSDDTLLFEVKLGFILEFRGGLTPQAALLGIAQDVRRLLDDAIEYGDAGSVAASVDGVDFHVVDLEGHDEHLRPR